MAGLVRTVVAVINILYLRVCFTKKGGQNRKLLQDLGKLDGVGMAGLQLIETLRANGSESRHFCQMVGIPGKALNAEQEIRVSPQFLAAIPSLRDAQG